MPPTRLIAASLALLCMIGCGRMAEIGRAPNLSPAAASDEATAMMTYGLGEDLQRQAPQTDKPSLWTGARGSLLGDRRAMQRGDILTVVIEIDDSATISNSTGRSRSGSEQMGISALFGLPQQAQEGLPEGANLDPGVQTNSSSSFNGDGSVQRNEQLELKVAATVTRVMPNGVLAIEGLQEVRVNFELRELLVSGFVRPEDITRQNEITYDKIASARISYGGRGQISDMQQPRYGQQAADIVLPF